MVLIKITQKNQKKKPVVFKHPPKPNSPRANPVPKEGTVEFLHYINKPEIKSKKKSESKF